MISPPSIVFFGPEPMSNLASFKRPPELIALAEKSLTMNNQDEQKEITRQLVNMMFDEALAFPCTLRQYPSSISPGPT